MGFTDFEARALEAIAPSFGSDEPAFRAQIAVANVVGRENTKVGFFTTVEIDRSSCGPIRFHQQGGQFDVEGVPHGLGVVLWDEDGYLKTVEGFTYVDSPLEGVELSDLKLLRVL